MSDPVKLLENVRWCIEYKPNIESNIMENDMNIKDIWNTVLFMEDTKIRCMLNNNDTFHNDIMVEKGCNVGTFLETIYNFYQLPLKTEYIRKAFWKNRELKEDVINEYDGDLTKIKNIDVFTTYIPVIFEGITKIKKNYYDLILGPT